MIDDTKLVERHGHELLVMSKTDWDNFTATVKEKYPDLYKEFKNTLNFDITPVSIIEREDND